MSVAPVVVRFDSVTVATVQAGFSVKLTATLTGGQSITLDPCLLRVIEDRPRPDKPALNITVVHRADECPPTIRAGRFGPIIDLAPDGVRRSTIHLIERVSVRVSGSLAANNSEALRDAALTGLGAARLPQLVVADDLAAGRLVSWGPAGDQAAELWALHTSRRLPSAKIKAFMDYLETALGRP